MSKLYVVGIGPGGDDHITPAARAAIEAAGVVVGYKTYLEFIPHLLAGKEVRSSGMMREVDRCREALALAAAGRTIALVSSGDAGVYGMAGLVLELVNGEEDLCGAQDIDIEIIPGISAVQAAAARLGAPLMHDFAVISLSDLMTPWPVIRQRLEAAAAADFVVALYNPRSRGRTTQIGEARRILLQHRAADTPVGIVRNACRDGEEIQVTDLGSFPEGAVDMFSMVVIGNSATFVDGAGRIVTPRGYEIRSQESGVRRQESGVGSQAEMPLPLTPHPSPLTGFGKALFVGGTGSDVGKSVLTAGLCRILHRRGWSVAPFKAQNMALNAAVTPQGGEIGRAQALQAAACGLKPHTDMNPVLLKPNSDTGCQVIIQGRAVGNMSAAEYHAYKKTAFYKVKESYRRLAAAHQVIILEGAGSIAEINLMKDDIANLRAAAMAGAPVLLVADIDRGGVFASIVGTLELLPVADRSRVIGVVINRFRGDPDLLQSGVEAVEARTGVPVLGVVPWLELHLPEEDSAGLDRKRGNPAKDALHIGVVRLPRIANFTDFDPLEREAGVNLEYLEDPAQLAGLDLLILPGTKNTLVDLEDLRARGWVEAIRDFHAGGGKIVGICGGLQMLGRSIADPLGMESGRREAEGIGLLDIHTILQPVKQTHQAEGIFLPAADAVGLPAGERACGYEIHLGESTRGLHAQPLLRLSCRSGLTVDLEDGAVASDARVWGTYLHGIFDNERVRRHLLRKLRTERGLPIIVGTTYSLEGELDRLADHLEKHLNLERIFRHLLPAEPEAGQWSG